MINNDVAGEMTLRELKAIETLASLVPQNGIIVEVGSYLGKSSWHWAKNADPSVTVYCLDPWDCYRGGSLDKFRENVDDCPNVIPIQGYSPNDFANWDEQIDLYFEDAVHKNPILKQNIDFWTGHLKPGGIVCGHDYTSKFKDVIVEANACSKRLGYQKINMDSFWGLLPPETMKELPYDFVKELDVDSISEFQHEILINDAYFSVNQGDMLTVCGLLKNATDTDWKIDAGPFSVKMGARVFSESNGCKSLESRGTLGIKVLPRDLLTEFTIKIPTVNLEAGTYKIILDLVIDYSYWFESKGASPVELSLKVSP